MLVERPWERLSSAHGNCAHIPDALAGLMAPTHEAREAARWRIDNHVVLQGDLYEGAPWVVRELIRQLEPAHHPGKALVYDLLLEFALADAPGSVVQMGHESVSLVAATRSELRLGRTLFQRDASDVEEEVARLAGELLSEVNDWGEPRE